MFKKIFGSSSFKGFSKDDSKKYDWQGYCFKNNRKVYLTITGLSFDPEFGIMQGQTEDDRELNGNMNRQGDFQFVLKDSDYNETFFWGSMSKEKDELRGDYGIENFESEGQFKLVCCLEEATSDTEPHQIEKPVVMKQSAEMTAAMAFVQSVIDAGEPWTDPDFKPCNESINQPGEKPLPSSQYQWKKASEIYGASYSIFHDGILPTDINQGELGNCYFLAVLSAMAEVPERIFARFITKESNKAGIYLMSLFVNGAEVPIIVDEYFPVKFGKPAFAKTKDGEIWAMLLEKAWAKMHGSYMRTEGGMCAHAVQHVLGTPAFTIDHKGKDAAKFWNDLKTYDSKSFVMMASSNTGTNAEFSDGIVLGHAYSLISVLEVTSKGKAYNLVKMRNPWGTQGEWTGAFSDKSNLWTPELKQQVGQTDQDDGLFFIPFENYLTHFSQTAVAASHNEQTKVAVANYQSQQTIFYSFTLTEVHNNLGVTVCQQGDRLKKYRPNERKDRFVPSPFSLILISEQGDIIGVSREQTMSNFFHSLMITTPVIEKGNYTLVVDVCWDECTKLDPKYDDILVRLYAQEQCTLEVVQQLVGEQTLAKALKKVGSSAKYQDIRAFYRKSDPEYGSSIYRVSDPKTAVGYYQFVYRKNDSQHASIEKLILKVEGLSFVGDNDTDYVEIASGSDHIFVMRNQEAFGASGYSMSMSMQQRGMSDAEMVKKCRTLQKQVLKGGLVYQNYLCDQGGCIVFENSEATCNVTIDIAGSSNLLIDQGETNLKTSVQVAKDGRCAVMFRKIQKNGSVSLSMQFGVRSVSTGPPPANDQWSDFVERVWPKYDKDGSGQLSRDETLTFLRNTFTGTAPSQFAALFELIDEDGTNLVTKAELIKFMRENCE